MPCLVGGGDVENNRDKYHAIAIDGKRMWIGGKVIIHCDGVVMRHEKLSVFSSCITSAGSILSNRYQVYTLYKLLLSSCPKRPIYVLFKNSKLKIEYIYICYLRKRGRKKKTQSHSR